MAIRGGFLAISLLMRDNDQYDSGEDGILPECRSCRLHRPYDPVQTCVYAFCPYTQERVSTRKSVTVYVSDKVPCRDREVRPCECDSYRHCQSKGWRR